jgi:SRSO17 transposase
MMLEEREQPFVLAVKSSEPLWSAQVPGKAQPRADAIAATLPAAVWQRLSAGAGSKGPRVYRWAWANLLRLGWPGWRHALLVREHVTSGERAYYVVFAPASATLAEVVRVAGTRWAIEQGFEGTKQEVGLDEYEVRKYEGWYRYITLALCAHAVLAVVRAAAAPDRPRKKGIHGVRSGRRRSCP